MLCITAARSLAVIVGNCGLPCRHMIASRILGRVSSACLFIPSGKLDCMLLCFAQLRRLPFEADNAQHDVLIHTHTSTLWQSCCARTGGRQHSPCKTLVMRQCWRESLIPCSRPNSPPAAASAAAFCPATRRSSSLHSHHPSQAVSCQTSAKSWPRHGLKA